MQKIGFSLDEHCLFPGKGGTNHDLEEKLVNLPTSNAVLILGLSILIIHLFEFK